MIEIDVGLFDQYTLELDRRLDGELLNACAGVAEQAEADAKALMEVQIYSAPISRSGYERTRKLIDSVQGYTVKTAKGFDMVVEATGGAQGRLYGSYVETGTRSSYVNQDVILQRARDADTLAPQSYRRGQNGMQARPAVTPAIAEGERNLEKALLEAVDKAGS